MLATCKGCGAEYRTHPSWLRRRQNGGYCSPQCRRTAHRVLLTCRHCGKTFEVRRSTEHTRKYCSRRCTARGAHPRTALRTCLICGVVFRLRGGGYRPGHGKYCSRTCYGVSRRGSNYRPRRAPEPHSGRDRDGSRPAAAT